MTSIVVTVGTLIRVCSLVRTSMSSVDDAWHGCRRRDGCRMVDGGSVRFRRADVCGSADLWGISGKVKSRYQVPLLSGYGTGHDKLCGRGGRWLHLRITPSSLGGYWRPLLKGIILEDAVFPDIARGDSCTLHMPPWLSLRPHVLFSFIFPKHLKLIHY